MRFGVLGPLAVWSADGRPVKVAELKVRALLANLLMHAGRLVSASRLIDDLWGEQLPVNPTNTLRTRVSQLRRALDAAEPGGRDLLVSQPPGYVLRVEPEAVDAGQFRALLAQARDAHDLEVRAAVLAEALALWRGPAYADFADEPFARAAIDWLEEERLVAVEEQADTRLALGEHALLVGELAGLVVRHPYRQRLRAAYMLALYRSGRHNEALDTYRELREHFADELGLDPSGELVALHQAILRQDPQLAAPVTRSAPATGRRSNLPATLTRLIGRDDAVRQLRSSLPASRLVTLTGPGGVGKTRLAVEVGRQVADRYADGVWLVELVELAAVDQGRDAPGHNVTADPARMIAGVLGLGDSAVDDLASGLRDRETLLILDNCEHVIEPVAKLSELLLRAAPGLCIVATSREALGIPGEVVWDVPPLALPDPAAVEPGAMENASAVRLFVERATAAAPGFRLRTDNARAVAAVCRRLDGIPLALELAAARVRGLGVHEVADRLDDRFGLLSAGLRGGPTRQHTLEAVIDWSWGLLTEPERIVLRRLSVHAGSCTLQAAEAICAADDVGAADVLPLLARLVDRSLVVRVEGPDATRYRLLESISAYGRERLRESGEFDRVLERHIGYYLGSSPHAQPRFYGHRPVVDYLSEAFQNRDAAARPGARRGGHAVSTVRSRDGTAIAFDRSGSGPPLILVPGALSDRSALADLTAQLAPHFTIFTYDRRGRGDSGDTPPYAVDREIDDIDALIERAGGLAYVYGASAGAVLALHAARRLPAITRLAVYEPPLILDDTRAPLPADFTVRLNELLAAARHGDAVELFLTEAIGMPAEVIALMRTAPTWPALETLAHTLPYDIAVMDATLRGDPTSINQWASITTPTLVINGANTEPFIHGAARALADRLPHAQRHTLSGQGHTVSPDAVAPALHAFFSSDPAVLR